MAPREQNFGRSVTISKGQGLIDVVTFFGPEETTRPPQLFTVSVYTDSEQASLLRGAFPFGVLEWGAGGVTQQADFDLAQGTTLGVPASFVRVKARWDTDGESAISTDTTMISRVSAILGFGSHPRSAHAAPRRTVGNFTAFANGASKNVTIPPFARAVRLIAAEESDYGALRLGQLTDTASSALCSVSPSGPDDVIPLLNGVRVVSVTNATGSSASALVQFELGL